MRLLIPELANHEVDLVVPATLAGRTTEERIRRRLTVKDPYVTRLRLEQLREINVDPMILSSLSHDDDYFVLALQCRYRPEVDGDDAPFVDSRIGVKFSAPDSARQPVALALAPDSASAASGRGLRIALTVPTGTGIDPSVEYASDGTREKRYITAHGRGESDPEWHLSDAPGHPLVGDIRLAVVVCAPANTKVLAEVIVAASLRRLGKLRTRAELPPSLHTIDLSAAARPALFDGPAGELAPGAH
jgi:hypothetical protein